MHWGFADLGEAMAAFLCARVIVRGTAPMSRHAKPSVDSADGVVDRLIIVMLCYVTPFWWRCHLRTGSPQPGTRTRARAWIQVANVGAAAAGGMYRIGVGQMPSGLGISPPSGVRSAPTTPAYSTGAACACRSQRSAVCQRLLPAVRGSGVTARLTKDI